MTINLPRSDFNDIAAKALLRDLARALAVDTTAITLEGIRPGSIETILRFKDSSVLADFINRHASGDADLQTVFDQWAVI